MPERFWRDPAPAASAPARVTNLALLGGARDEDFARAESRALFGAIRDATAAGATTTRQVLEALPPELRAYAEWIGQAGAEQGAAVDAMPPEKQARFAAEAVTALRLLNARREVEDIRLVLADEPGNAVLLGRLVALLRFVNAAVKAYPRADGVSLAALGRERGALPGRVPLEALRDRGAS